MRAYLTLAISFGMLVTVHSVRAQPAAVLGAPVPAAALGAPVAQNAPAQTTSFLATIRASSPDPLVGDYIPAARLGPISEARFGPDPAPDTLTSPQERYNWGLPSSYYEAPNPATDPIDAPRMRAAPTSGSQSKFGEKMNEIFGGGDAGGGGGGGGHSGWNHFESDHCFDDFISPVSNPFLSEDPRSLTELRPIFMFQTIPSSNSLYHSGNIEYLGLQARVAITQRFSLVMSKFGATWINPSSGAPGDSGGGFSEIWLGPKYTWYRDDQTGTISAAGLTFQIPTGPASVYQNTGGLSLAPYMNVAQKFGKSSWGSFNFMDTLGAAFSTTGQRSNYVYDSLHVDFDVANYHKFFPLIELNWLQYVRNGNANTLGFEGQDIANVGSTPVHSDILTLALGARYKMSEAIQFGLAGSFPLWGGTGDLQLFRLTADMIWRY
jgi:hypothetical protein